MNTLAQAQKNGLDTNGAGAVPDTPTSHGDGSEKNKGAQAANDARSILPLDPANKTAPTANAHLAQAEFSGIFAEHIRCGGRNVLPSSLVTSKRWLLWKTEERQGTSRGSKVPYYAGGTRRRDLDTPTDWANLASFDDALVALSKGGYDGLGFALGPDATGDFWQGIDFDHVAENGLSDLANSLPSYVEFSPSGTGCHALGRGQSYTALGSNNSGIEAYTKGRFFTFTGNFIRPCDLICLKLFVEEKLGPQHGLPRGDIAETTFEYVHPSTLRDLEDALFSMPSDDRELWVAMGQALKRLGPNGRSLFLRWSAHSEKHAVASDVKTWDSFKADRTSYRKVFTEAQNRGWKNPKSSGARGVGDAQAHINFSIQMRTAGEIASRPPSRWVVRGVIPEEGIGAIYGQPGSGKSFLALDLLASIGAGKDWSGRKVRGVPVVYAALEGQAGLAQRVAAYEAEKGPMEGISFIDSQFDLRNESHRAALVTSMREANLENGVLCIDTLAASAPGFDENASTDMGQLIGYLKELQQRLGGFVLVVHHAGKDDSRGLRGWSGLNGALDMVIEVSRSRKNNDRREWRITKSKDGIDGLGDAFRLNTVVLGSDDDGEFITSCTVSRWVLFDLPGASASSDQTIVNAEDDKFVYEWVKREVSEGKFPSKNSLKGQLTEMKLQRPITHERMQGSVSRQLEAGKLAYEKLSPKHNPWIRAINPSTQQDGQGRGG